MITDDVNELIKQNTIFFAQQLCDTIKDMVDETFIASEVTTADHLANYLTGFITSIRFSGKIEGCLYMVMSKELALKVMKLDINEPPDGTYIDDVVDFYKELINITGGLVINELQTLFDPIIIHPPEIAMGEQFLPDIFAGHARLNSQLGEIQCFLTVDMATLNIGIRVNQKVMEEKIKKRTEYLVELQKNIADNARKAGMADIATDILHNMGNVLNSVKASGNMISSILHNSSIKDLRAATTLLQNNMDNIDDFIQNDQRGKKLLEYFIMLTDSLEKESREMLVYSERLSQKTEAITDIVNSQQNYAINNSGNERLNVTDVINEALIMQEGSVKDIIVNNNIEDDYFILGQRIKLSHSIIHIIKNAYEAMKQSKEKKFTISIKKEFGDKITISFADTGCGIEKENLTKIFAHGFTTKEGFKGFGLHSCANYMTEMGAKIDVKSDGLNKGARVLLTFNEATEEVNDYY